MPGIGSGVPIRPIVPASADRASIRMAMASSEDSLFGDGPDDVRGYGRHSTGILPSHILRREIRAKRLIISTDDITDGQEQPASLDLRLGAGAHRVRAS